MRTLKALINRILNRDEPWWDGKPLPTDVTGMVRGATSPQNGVREP